MFVKERRKLKLALRQKRSRARKKDYNTTKKSRISKGKVNMLEDERSGNNGKSS